MCCLWSLNVGQKWRIVFLKWLQQNLKIEKLFPTPAASNFKELFVNKFNSKQDGFIIKSSFWRHFVRKARNEKHFCISHPKNRVNLKFSVQVVAPKNTMYYTFLNVMFYEYRLFFHDNFKRRVLPVSNNKYSQLDGLEARRAKDGPGVSSNITQLWFCALQNSREKWHNFLWIFMWSPKKKGSSRQNGTIFSGFLCDLQKKEGLRSSSNWPVRVISMGSIKPIGPFDRPLQAHRLFVGPPEAHGPRGHCPPYLPPPFRGPETEKLGVHYPFLWPFFGALYWGFLKLAQSCCWFWWVYTGRLSNDNWRSGFHFWGR